MTVKKILLLPLLFIFALVPPSAGAVVAESAAVAVTIATLKQTLDSTLRNLESSGNYLGIQLGAQLRMTIDAWEKANANLVSLTFSKLTEERQRFFRDLDNTISRLDNVSQQNLQEVQKVVAGLNQAAATLTLDGQPVVLRFSPGMIAPSSGTSDTQKISFSGANFSADYPAKLVFKSKGYQPSTRIDTQIEFLIPIGDLQFDQKTLKANAMELQVTEKAPWWKPWANDKLHRFPVTVVSLPQIAATYEIVYKLASTQREEQLQQMLYKHISGHRGGGETCRTDPIRPSPGWRIVWGSVVSEVIDGNCGRVDHTMVSELDGSLTVCNCEPRAFTPGARTGRARWDEYRDVPITSPPNTSRGTLYWGVQMPVNLPRNATNVAITTTLFNNEVLSGQNTHSFLSVTYDNIENRALFAPRPITPLY
ncbi:MAG: hypothetical protein ING75_17235 [Rhodocyclaceae bacterium]|nr:hypothetical protein [Rhodocyclaceae bacterium]